MKTTLEVVQAAQRWSTKRAFRPTQRACKCAPKGLVSERCDAAGDDGIVNEKIGNVHGELKVVRPRRSNSLGDFPPPISCIGKSGKPWISFKSYRYDGRFVLKQVRTPIQELLHDFREDGLLKLQFMHPYDESMEQQGFEKDDGKEKRQAS